MKLEDLAYIMTDTATHAMQQQLKTWKGIWLYDPHTIYMATGLQDTLKDFSSFEAMFEWFKEQGFHIEILGNEFLSVQKTFKKGDVTLDTET